MPEVMCQARGLYRIDVERRNGSLRLALVLLSLQPLGQPAADLRDLERMRQSTMEDVTDLRRRDLGNVSEPKQRGRVQDAIAISLSLRAGGGGLLA